MYSNVWIFKYICHTLIQRMYVIVMYRVRQKRSGVHCKEAHHWQLFNWDSFLARPRKGGQGGEYGGDFFSNYAEKGEPVSELGRF